MIFGVAADAAAGNDVIVQFLLKLAGDSVTIHGGSQVGSFQAFGEDSGAFVGRALAVLVYLAIFLGGACVEVAFGFGGGEAFVPWVLLVRGLSGVVIKQFRDRRLYASEGGGLEHWSTTRFNLSIVQA